MQAIICDKCGAMWVDQVGCEVHVTTIILSKGHSHTDHIGDWDLCENCKTGLFEYLKPNKKDEK